MMEETSMMEGSMMEGSMMEGSMMEETSMMEGSMMEETTMMEESTNSNDDGVIDNTIPKKPLPDTGGFTALMIGGSALLLLYGCLVAWRLKTRER
ncbi:MAG: hypothetical protein M3R38_20685 [Actinomycetota bacterium]|nr:hypothetical protein [Actinomycetota bacterium]